MTRSAAALGGFARTASGQPPRARTSRKSLCQRCTSAVPRWNGPRRRIALRTRRGRTDGTVPIGGSPPVARCRPLRHGDCRTRSCPARHFRPDATSPTCNRRSTCTPPRFSFVPCRLRQRLRLTETAPRPECAGRLRRARTCASVSRSRCTSRTADPLVAGATAVKLRVLGSDAGGGLPQWRCNGRRCAGQRQGRWGATERTQGFVAASIDGASCVLAMPARRAPGAAGGGGPRGPVAPARQLRRRAHPRRVERMSPARRGTT